MTKKYWMDTLTHTVNSTASPSSSNRTKSQGYNRARLSGGRWPSEEGDKQGYNSRNNWRLASAILYSLNVSINFT